MQIYQVGGCVRDRLLGRGEVDRDWVVVGSSPKEMEALGFQRVGKDFPVYLHPQSHEQYALARTERKSGTGYYGFEVDSSKHVTLEQDLARRDLTINAMAQTEDGEIIDPYGGRGDLKKAILRHVSPAFVEDPLRVLRVARFAARYKFQVAPATFELMREIAAGGELLTLAEERIWTELERALGEPYPAEFIRVLRQCNALRVLFPEIDCLFGVPQTARYHPEIDTGEHVCLALEQAATYGASSPVRFAVLVHDLGKGTTDEAMLPGHAGHEERGVKLVEDLCNRLRVPKAHRSLALTVTRYHLQVHRAEKLRPGKLLSLLANLDALRRPERFEELLLACEIDATGRAGLAHAPYPAADYLRRARDVVSSVDTRPLAAKDLDGESFRRAIEQLRVDALKQAMFT